MLRQPARHYSTARLTHAIVALRRAAARWRHRRLARAQVRALLQRRDDRLLDDIGTTRDALRRETGLWDED